MTTKHIVKTGDYGAAVAELYDNGGRLMAARDAEGPFIVVCGSRCTTFWPERSDRRVQVAMLARQLGFDEELATGGRLARYFLRELVGIDATNTYWGPKYRALSKEGWHWHYLHCVPGMHGYCAEFDLKSAYWSALLSGPSLFLDERNGWIDDGGALSNLKVAMDGMPKWFRLALVGNLASHEMKYEIIDKGADNPHKTTLKTQQQITWGAAFNATHRAILYVWRTLKHCHQLAGEHCKRMHTDSILLDAYTPDSVQDSIFKFLEEKQFKWSMKAAGDTYLDDVNCGIIGNKFIGASHQVVELMRERGIKIESRNPKPEKFGQLLPVVEQYSHGNLFQTEEKKEGELCGIL